MVDTIWPLLKVLAVLKIVVERELRPGPAAIEEIPYEKMDEILLIPVFAATELRARLTTVVRFWIPYVASTVLADKLMLVDKLLIGTKAVMLDRPGAIKELIEERPG